MPLDINAGGHRFENRERCTVCGMTRSKWEDSRERCKGPPAPKGEVKYLISSIVALFFACVFWWFNLQGVALYDGVTTFIPEYIGRGATIALIVAMAGSFWGMINAAYEMRRDFKSDDKSPLKFAWTFKDHLYFLVLILMITALMPYFISWYDYVAGTSIFPASCARPTVRDYTYFTLDGLVQGGSEALAKILKKTFSVCKPKDDDLQVIIISAAIKLFSASVAVAYLWLLWRMFRGKGKSEATN
jgi:hypothetical protein